MPESGQEFSINTHVSPIHPSTAAANSGKPEFVQEFTSMLQRGSLMDETPVSINKRLIRQDQNGELSD